MVYNLTLTWDVFKSNKDNTESGGDNNLTLTWDVFKWYKYNYWFFCYRI